MGSADGLVNDVIAFGRANVGGGALLAGEHLDSPDLGEGHDRAHRVAVELLELDHPGAQVGQDCRSERTGVEGPQLDHRDSGQGCFADRWGPFYRLSFRTRPPAQLVTVLVERWSGAGQIGRS